nr:hypothetical protein BaRGS_002924 [Batillaria attramentaria]
MDQVMEEDLADELEPREDETLEETVEETAEKRKKFLDTVELRQDVSRNRSHTGDYHHPYHKPDIVHDSRCLHSLINHEYTTAPAVYYTYRRFRKMKLVRHGSFWMGTNDPKSETGEYPLREVQVRSFYIDIYPVINAFYWAFRAKKRFVRSEAEVKGWSWVVEAFISPQTRELYSTPGPTGWVAVKKARWDRPEGPDSSLDDRWTHPVVHVSWMDAKRYCEFHGKRLPTEQEWEYASRSGLVAEEYPWGDRWQRLRANTWQGKWPHVNTEADGYKSTSPVDAYRPQNLLGLYDMVGNVWEWCHSRYYERLISRDLQAQMHVLKGGSYVDSVDGEHNLPVRNGQRTGQSPDYTASNVGFRCARSAPEMDPRPKPKPKPKPVDPKQGKVPKIYRKPQPDTKLKDEL